MVTNKLTREQKRQRMLEDKKKNKVTREKKPLVNLEPTQKINPRTVDKYLEEDY